MKIGIIGAGNVGKSVGARLARQGHEIVVSFAKSLSELDDAVLAIGGGARAGSVEGAATHGDVVLLAVPWAVALDTVKPIAGTLAGKIVWDATNPYKPTMDELELGTVTSAGEELAKCLPGAKVVKAIPPFARAAKSG